MAGRSRPGPGRRRTVPADHPAGQRGADRGAQPGGRGASGLFSTTQQLGGALGVALAGTVFFGRLGQHPFTGAFTGTLPVVAALFLCAAVLSLILPKTAVTDEHGF